MRLNPGRVKTEFRNFDVLCGHQFIPATDRIDAPSHMSPGPGKVGLIGVTLTMLAVAALAQLSIEVR